jgi:predicted ribosome quality control (RQC) complex YloA/Tae2 family protein
MKHRRDKARNDEVEEQAANTSQPKQSTEEGDRSGKKKHKKRKHTRSSFSSKGAKVDVSKSNAEEETVPKKHKTNAESHAQVNQHLSLSLVFLCLFVLSFLTSNIFWLAENEPAIGDYK